MTEAGFPDIAGEGWFAFVVPSGTPPAIAERLQREIVAATRAPAVQEKMAALGFEVVGSTPPAASAYLRSEGAKWTALIKSSGLKAE